MAGDNPNDLEMGKSELELTVAASGKFKDNPDRLPGLEQLVCIF